MAHKQQTSDSIIGSLCREVDFSRYRSTNIAKSINLVSDVKLISRLKNEFLSLQKRRNEIYKTALSIKSQCSYDSLEITFLIELCLRPIDYPFSELEF